MSINRDSKILEAILFDLKNGPINSKIFPLSFEDKLGPKILNIKNTNTNYGMIISENQNNGRGQYGKRWISYKGNLFISFFFKFHFLRYYKKRAR